MSLFRKFVNYFNPAGDTTTAEQAARIEAARLRNTAELGDAQGLAARYGLNHSEYNRAVQRWRQDTNSGATVLGLEAYIAARINDGTVRPGQ